ncbi:hypothetical protein FW778_08525 [Ginsengibacter hankyongi]|uniref:Uncharacterized protein n=1 Tax=Ginsengibacter hankyongi TaxID=2607284 RepID=A0A5J5ILS0_9BACT|nr:hypothetical protein [Ginsengibacter hankyongi]KAA9042046.1 hypothetical protein FW778_08525 [Ginsengibacter hankyongi]
MSEILLQAIVEKLEALEIALLKQGNAGKDEELKTAVKSFQSEFIKFSVTCNVNIEKMNKLSEEIHALKVNSGNSTQNQVKHIHHFHKQVWLSVSLFIISLLLAYGWINCSNEKKSFEANDIKYRFWKANGNSHLLKIVYYTDSLYNLDKNNFIQQVVRSERNIAKQEKMHRLAGEKEKEIR